MVRVRKNIPYCVLRFVYFYRIKFSTTHFHLMRKLSLREMKSFAQSYIRARYIPARNQEPRLQARTSIQDLGLQRSLTILPPPLSTTKLTVEYLG